MAYVNVAEWSPRHVAEWLRGLDDTVQPYVQFFLNNNINGCHLLTLASNDLIHLNVVKIGHQEIILEAVDLLRQLHYNLTSENLQSLCLKLGCKARSLYNALKRKYSSMEKGKSFVSTETLSSVSDILALVKILISWLDRYPFEGQGKYKSVRKTILQHSIELASTAQRDQFAEKPHEIIQKNCYNIAEQCDTIVQKFSDSLIIQPASLRVATVKKRSDEDLGIHIHSSYSGIHIIGAIKFQSPAYHCGKVSEGDEIIQVNYQTVVGWQLKNLVCATNEHPSEIHLTIKKRPQPSTSVEEVITMWPFRIPSKRTAFRKMNKWSKNKSAQLPVSEVLPAQSSSSSLNHMNGSEETANNTSHISFGMRQQDSSSAVKRRPRVNRRATIDSVPPLIMHFPINMTELKSAFRTVEPSAISKKYSTNDINKNSDPDKGINPTVFSPVASKFGSTDGNKWKRETEKNYILIDNDSKVKYSSPEFQEVPAVNCKHNEYNSGSSTSNNAMETADENTERISQCPSSLSNGCIHSNLIISKDNTSPSVKKHAKITEAILEEKTSDVEKDRLSCDSSLGHNIDNIENINHSEVSEDIRNGIESDDRSEATRFQVVSFPSPGANTRTFRRQDKLDKKSSQSVIVSGEANMEYLGKKALTLNNQSPADFSEGQSDTSLEDITVGSKCMEEATENFCQFIGAPNSNSISINYDNNYTTKEEMLNYRKQKKNVPRPQRRFTTDHPFFPRELQSEHCSAFKPISFRSISCIDVSQITENLTNSEYLPSQKFLSPADKEMVFSSHQNQKNIESFQTFNSKVADLLHHRISQTQQLDSIGILSEGVDRTSKNCRWKQKEASNVSAGYVAKIAESFNLISNQQKEQVNDCRSNAPYSSVHTGQLYQPAASYSSLLKPKPLRADQLMTSVQSMQDASIHEKCFDTFTSQKNKWFQPGKLAVSTEDGIKGSRKESPDIKQSNRLLRTATSEEIQNMYTTYGNSGRAFESRFVNGETTCTVPVRENGKVSTVKHKLLSTEPDNNCRYHEFQVITENKNNSMKKCQKQTGEQLSEKLKALIFGEKEHTVPVPLNQSTELALISRSRVSAAVQTDMLEESLSCYEDSCLNISFASQESGHGNSDVFCDKNCQNLSDDSVVYSSNSSLTSSTSSGSHYYYVETQIRPELTISVPLTNQIPSEEVNDCNKNSNLPRMGVAAMLGKKRSVSHGSSDSGSSEVKERVEQMKEYSSTYKSMLSHSIVPIDV